MGEQNGIFVLLFWKKTAERIVAGTASTLAGLFFAGDVLGIIDIDFKEMLSVAGYVALAYLLICLAGTRIGDSDSPSLLWKKTKDGEEK